MHRDSHQLIGGYPARPGSSDLSHEAGASRMLSLPFSLYKIQEPASHLCDRLCVNRTISDDRVTGPISSTASTW